MEKPEVKTANTVPMEPRDHNRQSDTANLFDSFPERVLAFLASLRLDSTMVEEIKWEDLCYFKWLYKGVLYSKMDGKTLMMLVPKAITATDANKVYNRACCLRR
jgi:hypothetical protein